MLVTVTGPNVNTRPFTKVAVSPSVTDPAVRMVPIHVLEAPVEAEPTTQNTVVLRSVAAVVPSVPNATLEEVPGANPLVVRMMYTPGPSSVTTPLAAVEIAAFERMQVTPGARCTVERSPLRL